MNGKKHDRGSAATRLGTKGPAAYEKLELLAELVPGVLKAPTRGGQHQFSYRAPMRADEPPTLPTVVAACFGASLAPLFEGSEFPEQMRAAVEYLVRRSRHARRFTDMARKFWFVARGGEMALPDNGGRLQDLIGAVLESERVQLRYVHFDGEEEVVDVEPLSLAVHEHQLYILGRPAGRPVHPYRFSRIAAHDRLGKRFTYPSPTEYDPQQVLRDSFGVFVTDEHPVEDVVLLLDPVWATYVRTHRWHGSQKVVGVREDGRIEMQLRVRTCPELRRWILGFGGEAEVVAPAGLREAVARAAGTAAGRYRAT